MYDRILVPVDGSEGAAAVLEHVGELARRVDADVELLFVADTARDSVTLVEGNVVDALVSEGEDVLADAAETLAEVGVDAETATVQGNPAPSIAEYADRYDHDLIAMATHGDSGARGLLGSVTEKVVRLADIPVLVARLRDDERLTAPYERVLLPTDGSPRAEAAAAHGLDLAAALGASVDALSVVEEGGVGATLRSLLSDEERDRSASEAVARVEKAGDDRDLSAVRSHVERGNPAEVIVDAVDEYGVDAVVMGTTGEHGAEKILLGGVAERTLRNAPVPVIVVPSEE
ncbi:universal stress protein [Haloparvum sedimenti]|uniref:universal stress protein n=1 Tax=Haloparvum sedimenti TaxID=1678448 RepID=UPI00071E6E4E|nr:universal stress protein [Haloparvum sedimenti]